MVEGARMAPGFCVVKVGLGESTVRIMRVLRKDVNGRRRSRGRASSPARLALPRADRRVGLPHQAVRLVFLRGLWRSLGGLRVGRRERYRVSGYINHGNPRVELGYLVQ